MSAPIVYLDAPVSVNRFLFPVDGSRLSPLNPLAAARPPPSALVGLLIRFVPAQTAALKRAA